MGVAKSAVTTAFISRAPFAAAAAAFSVPPRLARHRLASVDLTRPLAGHWRGAVGAGDTAAVGGRRSLTKRSAGVEGELLCEGRLPMRVHHLPTVESTQDEARRILVEDDVASAEECPICFAVSASEQSRGRGTKGRDWIGRPGNCFVTVCLPSDLIGEICPLSLLPLKVGTIVAQQTHRILQRHGSWPKVRVKWPNDVLVDDKKIAGVLIESHYDSDSMESWFLVGIGVNVAHAPRIYQFGPQRGRQATCLAEHCTEYVAEDGVEESQTLAADIAQGIHGWACAAQSPEAKVDKALAAEAIVREWSEWAEFGKEQVLRDMPGNEAVIPLGVEPDGQLRVKRKGKITLLCSDYLL